MPIRPELEAEVPKIPKEAEALTESMLAVNEASDDVSKRQKLYTACWTLRTTLLRGLVGVDRPPDVRKGDTLSNAKIWAISALKKTAGLLKEKYQQASEKLEEHARVLELGC